MAAERVIKVKLIVDAPASNDTAAKRTAQGLDDVASKADKGGASLISFGTILKTALVAGAAIATKSMLDLGMSYEKSLNQLQAVSGASALKLAEVSDAAKQLGNDISLPGASAADAAKAMTELAKGGLSVDEAMKAAKGTLQLAAAAQIDGAQAATIQSSALNTFGLAASDAGRVADVLANAANASSGEITDFAQGLAQSGLAAKAMGISVEDTATTLALFANNGLSGSDAGTSFKTMLISLTNPSKNAAAALETLGVKAFDAQGNFVGMRTVTEQLSEAQKTMTTEQFNAAAATAFGTDALRAAVAVAESGVEGYDSMSEAIGKTGGAAELAAANSKGLAGAVDLVKNAAETAALGLYEQLSPALDAATRGIANMVPQVAEALLPALEQAGMAFIGLVNILAPLVPTIGEALASAVSALASALGALAPVITVAVEGLGFVLNAVAGLPGPITAAAAAFALLTLTAPFGALVTAIGGMVAAATTAGSALAALRVAALAAFSNPVILAAAAVAAAIGVLVFANDDAATAVGGFTGAIDEQTGALKENADAILIQGAATDGTLAKLRAVGVDAGTFAKALAGDPEKIAEVDAALRKATDAAQQLNDNRPDFGGIVGGDTNLAVQIQRDYIQEAADATEAWRLKTSGLANEMESTKAAIAAAGGATFEFAGSAKEADQSVNPLLDAIRGTGEAASALGGSTDSAAVSLDLVSEALKSTNDAASTADDALKFFQITVNAMAGINVSAEQATKLLNDQVRATAKAFTDASEATEGNTASLLNSAGGIDTTTEAGSKLYDSLQGMREGYDTATTAAYGNTVATEGTEAALLAAQKAAQGARDKFIANAQAAGLNAEQAGRLADQLGIVEGTKLTDKNFALSATGLTATQIGLAAVKAAIDAIPASRTIAINYRGPQGGVPVAVEADGGIRKGGVQVMANGGFKAAANGLMSRQAQIAKAGSYVLWAEDETGGESYVPHALSKRKRSQEIMAKTAAMFGDTYVVNGAKFMANGGFSGGSAPAAPVIVKEFPLTIVNQSVPLTADGLRRIQREAERLNA